MEIAILGLKQSGKSTLFQIMTGIKSGDFYGETTVRGIAKIPDVRFNKLAEIFKPEKTTPATVPFIDVNASGEKGWDAIRQSISGADGILHVVDCFTAKDTADVIKRYRTLDEELILSDLIVVEKRMERLLKLPQNTLGPDETIQKKLMPSLKDHLESGKPLRTLKLSDSEIKTIKNFAFWSIRPELVVLNISEGSPDPSAELKEITDSPVIAICCQIEAEIASLPESERKEFLDSLGTGVPAFQTIIQKAFSQLGRIYYFTVGEDEVRAWVIRKNSTAPQAAAAIHKDFERGFIKAEVVSYNDFISSGGTLSGAKSAGKLRLEGKEYIVQDGDIISFRFNV